jgi:hypothetical protein
VHPIFNRNVREHPQLLHIRYAHPRPYQLIASMTNFCAYSQDGAITQSDALSRIRQVLDAEWSAPTDAPERLE